MSNDSLADISLKKHPIYPIWVSQDGKFFREVKQQTRNGYKFTVVRHQKTSKVVFSHKMVLETYVGECPEGMQVRHLNGVRDDNNLSNLAWGTPLENGHDRKRHRYLLAKYIEKYGHLDLDS